MTISQIQELAKEAASACFDVRKSLNIRQTAATALEFIRSRKFEDESLSDVAAESLYASMLLTGNQLALFSITFECEYDALEAAAIEAGTESDIEMARRTR